jgi:hypothetical protein
MNLCTPALQFCVNCYTIKLIYCKHGYSILGLISKCCALCYYHNLLALCNCYSTTLGGSAGCGTVELRPLSQAVSIMSGCMPSAHWRELFKHKIEVQNKNSSSGWNIFQVILNVRTYTEVYIYIDPWFHHMRQENMQLKLIFLAPNIWNFISSLVPVKNVSLLFSFWPSLSKKMSKFYTIWKQLMFVLNLNAQTVTEIANFRRESIMVHSKTQGLRN